MIELTDADEDPSACLANLAQKCGPQLISDVHLVQWAYESENPKWQSGLAALRTAGIPCYMHSTLDEEALKTLQSKALVRLDPALYVTDGALRMLIDQMAARSSWSFVANDHFAISSEIWINPDAKMQHQLGAWTEAAFAYGWLLVVLVLDTFRFYCNFGAYHRNIDLTGRLVSVTFPNRTVLAPHRWWWFWGGLGSGIALPQNGAGACLLVPRANDQGMGLVLRLVRAHRSMGLGLWLLGFALYYAAFAFPWWNAVLPRQYIPFWWMEQSLDPRQWTWYWQTLQLAHLLVVALVSYNQMRLPWKMQPMQVLFYPFYLATAPFFFFHARMSRSRALYAVSAELMTAAK